MSGSLAEEIEAVAFERLARALCDAEGIFLTDEPGMAPPSFPAVEVELASCPDDPATADSGGRRNSVVALFEANVYADAASGGKAECWRVAEIVASEFDAMGFRCTSRSRTPSPDPGTWRVTLRFRGGVFGDLRVYNPG